MCLFKNLLILITAENSSFNILNSSGKKIDDFCYYSY